MLASIHPLGERARHNRYGVTATAHVVGSSLGGAVAGAVAGALGAAVFAVARPSAGTLTVVAVTLCLVAAAVDLTWRGRRLPGPQRQVDEDWMGRYRGWVYGAGFGLQLGTGVVTIVTTAAVYATFALATLSGSAAAGALIGAIFGLVRGATLFLTAGLHTPAQVRALHRRVAATAPWARSATVASLVVLPLLAALWRG